MLHIVNGDGVGRKLKAGGIGGEVLVWRGIYTAGPVLLPEGDPANRGARAAWLEREMGIPGPMYLVGCEEQEAALSAVPAGTEIVLWFEHDLFDQTMLCRLLHGFATHPALTGRFRLSQVSVGAYPGIEPFHGLGQLTPEQLADLAPERTPVGEAELGTGRRVWEAYASPDPADHVRLLREDTSALPFVREAFEAHLRRLPSTLNGVGSVGQAVLEELAAGPVSPVELFRAVGDRLGLLGMGDTEFGYRLHRLAAGGLPLVALQGFARFPGAGNPVETLRGAAVGLTAAGERVLAGDAVWPPGGAHGEWFGGLQLREGGPAWAWDPVRGTVADRRSY